MEQVFMTFFFARVGYTASLRLLKKGGVQVVLLVVVSTVIILAQDGLGSDVGQIPELVGLGLDAVCDTEELERDTIVYPKFHRDKCIGCGRCAISCLDGGHQAIHFGDDRKPILEPKKCVGCHLCTLVCPTEAITASRKRI